MNIQCPYFDNNATTQVLPEVLEVLNEYQSKYFANPSSVAHPYGMWCNALYKEHRRKIADILQINEDELIFTSGATESINTAIKGIFFQYASQKNHIVSCKTEHSAVLQTLEYLQKFHHAEITLLNVNEQDEIDLNDLEKSISDKTLMVCLMAANNETGVVHPLEDIYRITQKKKVIFFSDTTQLFGKKEINQIPADVFCGSAHKFHGSKGIGFLAVRNLGRSIFLHPILHGGNQQTIRSGTIPLPLIAGLSKALEMTMSLQHENISKIKHLRDYFENKMKEKFSVKINGEKIERLVNTSNITFSEKDYEYVLAMMKKFCFSRSSACSDGSGKPSHVLSAMRISKDAVQRSFRFSFSKLNTKEEVDLFFGNLDKLSAM